MTGTFDCEVPPTFKVSMSDRFNDKLPQDAIRLDDMRNGTCLLRICGYTNFPRRYNHNWIDGGSFIRRVSLVCKYDSNHKQVAKRSSN